jgi:hypothetical protein
MRHTKCTRRLRVCKISSRIGKHSAIIIGRMLLYVMCGKFQMRLIAIRHAPKNISSLSRLNFDRMASAELANIIESFFTE